MQVNISLIFQGFLGLCSSNQLCCLLLVHNSFDPFITSKVKIRNNKKKFILPRMHEQISTLLQTEVGTKYVIRIMMRHMTYLTGRCSIAGIVIPVA